MRNLIITTLAFSTVLLIVATPAIAKDQYFRAVLNGDNAGSGSSATGVAYFHLTDTEIRYSLSVTNLSNLTQAHIHVLAKPGDANGSVRLWLFPEGAPATLLQGSTSGLVARGVLYPSDLQLSGNEDLKETWKTVIRAMRNGSAYVNVHTQAFPAGEIRGPIVRQ